MSNLASVEVKWDKSAIRAINRKTIEGLFRMGFDIAAQARRNAPYVSGALRGTIRVNEVSTNELEVIAGGSFGGRKRRRKVDYAWIREQGPNRNPATEHYMENAQKLIMSGNYMQKYFGKVTK